MKCVGCKKSLAVYGNLCGICRDLAVRNARLGSVTEKPKHKNFMSRSDFGALTKAISDGRKQLT